MFSRCSFGLPQEKGVGKLYIGGCGLLTLSGQPDPRKYLKSVCACLALTRWPTVSFIRKIGRFHLEISVFEEENVMDHDRKLGEPEEKTSWQRNGAAWQ